MTPHNTLETKTLAIAAIRRDGGTQPRAALDEAIVADYAADMRGGAPFPPGAVMYDGTDYWLYDGFHRTAAAEAAGLESFDYQVTQVPQDAEGQQAFSSGKPYRTGKQHKKRRNGKKSLRGIP